MSWKSEYSNLDYPIGRAHYFSRAPIPFGSDIFWHHIGVYGWKRAALKRFVESSPSDLEQTEKLEQLRALELDMTIGAGRVHKPAAGIDTPQDLIDIRKKISGHLKRGNNE